MIDISSNGDQLQCSEEIGAKTHAVDDNSLCDGASSNNSISPRKLLTSINLLPKKTDSFMA